MFNEIERFLFLRIILECEALPAGLLGKAGLAGVGNPYLNRPQPTRAQSFAVLAHSLSRGSLLLFSFAGGSGLSPLGIHTLKCYM